MTTKPLNLTIIIGILIFSILMSNMTMNAYSVPAFYGPQDYYESGVPQFFAFLASNPLAAIIVFVGLIGGLLGYLGYTIYKIFFKYK